MDGPGSPTTASGHGLDHHRPAGSEEIEEVSGGLDLDGLVEAGQDRDTGLGRHGPSPTLVAEQGQGLGRRADEGQPGRGAGLGQGRVLGQEAVAGMDRVTTGSDRGGNHGLDVEVAGDPTAGEGNDLVAGPSVLGCFIVRSVDHDRVQAETGGGPGDPDGDLSPIGDQEIGKRHGSSDRRLHGLGLTALELDAKVKIHKFPDPQTRHPCSHRPPEGGRDRMGTPPGLDWEATP